MLADFQSCLNLISISSTKTWRQVSILPLYLLIATCCLPAQVVVHGAFRAAGCEDSSASDVVFLVDASNGVLPLDFRRQLTFLQDVISRLPVGPNSVRVAVVTYADFPHLEFNLNHYTTKTELRDAIGRIRQNGGFRKSTGDAIRYAIKNVLDVSENTGSCVRRIGVVIMNERSDNRTASEIEAHRAKESGVRIFAVGVRRNVDPEELRGIVSRPNENHTLLVNSFTDLAKVRELLAVKISEVANSMTTSTTSDREMLKGNLGKAASTTTSPQQSTVTKAPAAGADSTAQTTSTITLSANTTPTKTLLRRTTVPKTKGASRKVQTSKEPVSESPHTRIPTTRPSSPSGTVSTEQKTSSSREVAVNVSLDSWKTMFRVLSTMEVYSMEHSTAAQTTMPDSSRVFGTDVPNSTASGTTRFPVRRIDLESRSAAASESKTFPVLLYPSSVSEESMPASVFNKEAEKRGVSSLSLQTVVAPTAASDGVKAHSTGFISHPSVKIGTADIRNNSSDAQMLNPTKETQSQSQMNPGDSTPDGILATGNARNKDTREEILSEARKDIDTGSEVTGQLERGSEGGHWSEKTGYGTSPTSRMLSVLKDGRGRDPLPDQHGSKQLNLIEDDRDEETVKSVGEEVDRMWAKNQGHEAAGRGKDEYTRNRHETGYSENGYWRLNEKGALVYYQEVSPGVYEKVNYRIPRLQPPVRPMPPDAPGDHRGRSHRTESIGRLEGPIQEGTRVHRPRVTPSRPNDGYWRINDQGKLVWQTHVATTRTYVDSRSFEASLDDENLMATPRGHSPQTTIASTTDRTARTSVVGRQMSKWGTDECGRLVYLKYKGNGVYAKEYPVKPEIWNSHGKTNPSTGGGSVDPSQLSVDDRTPPGTRDRDAWQNVKDADEKFASSCNRSRETSPNLLQEQTLDGIDTRKRWTPGNIDDMGEGGLESNNSRTNRPQMALPGTKGVTETEQEPDKDLLALTSASATADPRSEKLFRKRITKLRTSAFPNKSTGKGNRNRNTMKIPLRRQQEASLQTPSTSSRDENRPKRLNACAVKRHLDVVFVVDPRARTRPYTNQLWQLAYGITLKLRMDDVRFYPELQQVTTGSSSSSSSSQNHTTVRKVQQKPVSELIRTASKMLTRHTNKERGAKRGARRKVAIYITDGPSGNMKGLRRVTQDIKTKGKVEFFVVGIGEETKMFELASIADSKREGKHLYRLNHPQISDLEFVAQELTASLCG